MKPSSKQGIILAALKTKPEITLAEAVRLIGGHLYCHAEKHVGATLSNMVKRGMIERVKPGVYRLPTPTQREWAQVPLALRDRAFFSAGVAKAEITINPIG